MNAVLRHSIAEAEARVQLEGVRTKVMTHIPSSHSIEEDRDREMFK